MAMREGEGGASTAGLSFVVTTAGGELAAWQAAALHRLLLSGARLVLHVAVHNGTVHPIRTAGRAATLFANGYWRMRLARRGRALERTVFREHFDAPLMATDVEDDGSAPASLPAGVLQRIAEVGSDVVVNFSGVPLAGLPRELATYGVWEYRVSSAAPHVLAPFGRHPGLLELALARVRQPFAPDEVIVRGWVQSVPHSFTRTMDTVYFAPIEWLARTHRVIEVSQQLPSSSDAAHADVLAQPSARVLRAMLATPWRKLRWATRQLIREEHWHVGVIERPLEAVYESRDVSDARWLPNVPAGRYLADPFGIEAYNCIIAEQFDYWHNRGRLVAVREDDGRVFAEILPVTGHTSYPFVFVHDGDIYCVPETSDVRRATLHRARRFPERWETVCTLVEGIAVTDPTIVRHEGRWWLFFTDNDHGPGSNLHLYHAAALNGPWRPHPLNPVKIDIRSARPAGTPFVFNGTLIRPAQNNDEGYGSSVVFNEVRVLTTSDFAEVPTRQLLPSPNTPYRHGLHTVSAWGRRTLVDGKQKRYGLRKLAGRLGVRLSHHGVAESG